MANGLFVVGTTPASGKSMVALGLHRLLARRIGRLGVFRPVVEAPDGRDPVVDVLRGHDPDEPPYPASLGVSYDAVHAGEQEALGEIVARYRALAATCDAVLSVGTDYTDVGAPTELAFNAHVAVNLGLPVVCVVSGHGRSPAELRVSVDVGRDAMAAAGCVVVGVVANRVARGDAEGLREQLAGARRGPTRLRDPAGRRPELSAGGLRLAAAVRSRRKRPRKVHDSGLAGMTSHTISPTKLSSAGALISTSCDCYRLARSRASDSTASAALRPESRRSPPDRAIACSSVSTVSTPNAHGTPVDSWTSWMPRAASAQTQS